ncbi:MAG: hypothetical protein ACOYOB_17900, partial [Myxococcota bacterium]
FRSKGSDFDVEVFVHDGAGARPVGDGATVRPGDRIGFRLHVARPSHVWIVGLDAAGEVYRCYPQAPGVGPVLVPGAAAPIDVPEFVEFDATPGAERIVALSCPQPVAFEVLAASLRAAGVSRPNARALPPLLAGCSQRETRLRKAAAGARP